MSFALGANKNGGNEIKKTLKGVLALFLAAVLVFGAAPLAGVASLHLSLSLRDLFTVRANAATSGSCGDNATFNISGGTLTVSGTGDIDDYCQVLNWDTGDYEDYPPWYGEAFNRVVVQSGITGIGALAFYESNNLTSVILPETVTYIGGYAFSYCPVLAAFTIPDSVTGVGDDVFKEDEALVSVHIGAGLTDHPSYPLFHIFEGATSLAAVTVAAGHPSLYTENGILYNKAKTDLIFCPAGKTGAVTMPATVVTIRDYAFESCENLATVEIGSGLEYFNNTLFEDCGSLTAVNFDAANPNYASHDGAVYDKGKATLLFCPLGKTSVAFPAEVTAIGEDAFAGCAEIISITLPDTVVSVGDEAFNYCYQLETIAFGTGVADLGYDLFFYCDELKTITVAAGNTHFKAESGVLFDFAKTKLIAYPPAKADTSYTVPAGVKTIDINAFQLCNNLETVSLPSGLTTIEEYAFGDCTNLASVNLPATLTSIGDYAFYGCEAYLNPALPAGTLDIGYDAFYGSGWYNNLPEGRVAYVGKVAYEYIGTEEDDYGRMPEGYNLVLKADTTAIARGAFSEQYGLTSVTFPALLTWIGEEAFFGCDSLMKVAVPKTVKTIGDSALGYTYFGSYTVSLPGFKMYCSAGSTAHIYAQENGITRYVPATPGSPKAASASYNSAKVTWTKTDDYVTGYRVYRATAAAGPYTYLGTTGKTTFSYTDTGRTTGVTYYYKIIAERNVLGAKIYSSSTAAVSAVPVPAAPGSVKAARYSSTSIKVSWAAVAGASGYVLYRYSSSAGTYVKVKVVTGATSTVNGGLSKGVNYYYRVRAYRTVNGKNWYSGYSARASAKTY